MLTVTVTQGVEKTIANALGYTKSDASATPTLNRAKAYTTIQMSWTINRLTKLAIRQEHTTKRLETAKQQATSLNPVITMMHNAHNVTHHLRPEDIRKITVWDSNTLKSRSLMEATAEKGQCRSNWLMGVESAEANGNWFILCEAPLVTLRNQCLDKSVKCQLPLLIATTSFADFMLKKYYFPLVL